MPGQWAPSMAGSPCDSLPANSNKKPSVRARFSEVVARGRERRSQVTLKRTLSMPTLSVPKPTLTKPSVLRRSRPASAETQRRDPWSTLPGGSQSVEVQVAQDNRAHTPEMLETPESKPSGKRRFSLNPLGTGSAPSLHALHSFRKTAKTSEAHEAGELKPGFVHEAENDGRKASERGSSLTGFPTLFRRRTPSVEAKATCCRPASPTGATSGGSSVPAVVKPLRLRVLEERVLLRPTVLAATSRVQRFALSFLAWWRRALCEDWVDEAFALASAYRDVVDDGLFRSAANVHRSEPWNRERLHLQLFRAFWPKQRDIGCGNHEANEVVADECREVVRGSGCTLRLSSAADTCVFLPVKRSVALQRDEVYELRVDVECVAFSGLPKVLELDSREGRCAAQLLRIYMTYSQQADSDLVSLMDGRLDALVEHGAALRGAMEEASFSGAPDVARDMFRQHLEERRALRLRRDEKENQIETLGRSLYAKWKELRVIRQEQGFCASPWRLRARTVDQDHASDTQRRARNIQAEIEEVTFLQGVKAKRARSMIEHRWDASKRAAGQPSHIFGVFAGEEVTSDDWLQAHVRDEQAKEREGQPADTRVVEWLREVERRRTVGRTRVRLACRVDGRNVAWSPASTLHPETWSTESCDSFRGSDVEKRASKTENFCTFNVAVQVMPRRVQVCVHVAVPGRLGLVWTRWRQVAEVTLDVPNVEGKRVTHSATLHQRKCFGPEVTGSHQKPDLEASDADSFGGEVVLGARWLGAELDGTFVVPPPSDGGGSTNGFFSSWLPRFVHVPVSRSSKRPLDEPVDKRLRGTRYDPHDPENVRMLSDLPVPPPPLGYDVDSLAAQSCSLTAGGVRVRDVKRVKALLERAGMATTRHPVPAFDVEVDESRTDNADFDTSMLTRWFLQRRLAITDDRRAFILRGLDRVRGRSSKKYFSHSSVVREQKLRDVFQRSAVGGKAEGQVRNATILAAVANVRHMPLRHDDPITHLGDVDHFWGKGSVRPVGASVKTTDRTESTKEEGVDVFIKEPEILVELSLCGPGGKVSKKKTDTACPGINAS